MRVFARSANCFRTGILSKAPAFEKLAHGVLSLFLFLLFLGYRCPPGLAQDSLINTIEETQRSIVTIKAMSINLGGLSSPQAALDPHTGKVVELRQVLTSHYEKSGAGIIIDPAGIIVTNLHTIFQCNYISVILADGQTLPAKVLDIVGDYDLAFLKVDAKTNLPEVTFADSNQVTLGQDIVTVGNSKLLSQTISGGKIIGIGTHDQGQNTKTINSIDLFQVNINIYHGDSGGPLFDRQGRLIGLMFAKQTDVNRSSFAIPSNKIRMYYQEYLHKRFGKK